MHDAVFEQFSNAGLTTDGPEQRGVIHDNRVKGYVPYAASLNDDDCTGTPPQAFQTTAAYVWSDDWARDWIAIPGYLNAKVWIACPELLRAGIDWHLDVMPPGYLAYPYPHPLRDGN